MVALFLFWSWVGELALRGLFLSRALVAIVTHSFSPVDDEITHIIALHHLWIAVRLLSDDLELAELVERDVVSIVRTESDFDLRKLAGASDVKCQRLFVSEFQPRSHHQESPIPDLTCDSGFSGVCGAAASQSSMLAGTSERLEIRRINSAFQHDA